MKSARLLLGSLVAVFSLGSAAPALAKQAYPTKTNNGVGVSVNYNYGYPTKRAHFNQELEEEILSLVNSLRYKKGLPALQTESHAFRSARLVAREAGQEGSFSDIDDNLRERLTDQGIDLTWRSFGEARAIIEEDNDVDVMARQIVKKWLKNPKFSKVIFHSDLSYVGIGAYVSRDGEVTVALNAFGVEHKPLPLPKPIPQPIPQPDHHHHHGCGDNY